MSTKITAEQIAQVCHEANRGYQAAVPTPGIPVAPPWDEFPDDQKAGVIRGVLCAMDGASPEELHEAWCWDKLDSGWRYGPTKDAVSKEHPCLMPYEGLPMHQQIKDHLFQAIVSSLKPGEEV